MKHTNNSNEVTFEPENEADTLALLYLSRIILGQGSPGQSVSADYFLDNDPRLLTVTITEAAESPKE